MAIQLAPSPLADYVGPIQVADANSPARGFQQSRQIFEDISDVPVRQAQRKAQTDTARLQSDTTTFERKQLSNFQAQLPEGATEFDVAYMKAYSQKFGPPPKDPTTGKVDLAELRRRGDLLWQHNEKLLAQEAQTKGMNFSTMTLEKDGIPHKYGVYTSPTGEVKQIEIGPDSDEITRRSVASSRVAPGGAAQAKTVAEAKEHLTSVRSLRNSVTKARAILDKPGEVVGPKTGSAPVRFAVEIGALFGAKNIPFLGDPTQIRDDQEALNWLSSNLTLENATKLKGPLSEKELGFLMRSIPQLKTSETNWKAFLTEFDQILAEREKTLAETSGAEPAAAAEEAPAAPTSQFPPAVGRDRYIRNRKTGKLYLQKADGTITEVTSEAEAPTVAATPAPAPPGGTYAIPAPAALR